MFSIDVTLGVDMQELIDIVFEMPTSNTTEVEDANGKEFSYPTDLLAMYRQ